MPRLQDIEQFKSEILSLGNEPSIMADRGEKVRDVPPPEAGLSDDLSSLLDEVDQELGLESLPSESAPPDFDFDDAGDDLADDLEDDTGADTADDTADDMVDFGAETFPEDDLFPDEPFPQETGDEEGSDLDDFLYSFDGMDGFEESDETPEESGETPEEQDETPDEAPLDDDFGVSDDFDLPDFPDAPLEDEPESGNDLAEIETGELEPEELEPEELEEGDEPSDNFNLDSFDMPDLEDEEFSLDEPGSEGFDSFDLPDLDEPSTDDAETFSMEEDFSIDDETGGDFDLGGDEEEAEELQELDDEGDDFSLEEFSLGDLGQDFDVLDEEKGLGDVDLDEEGEEEQELAASEGEEINGLSEEDFDRTKATLLSLPLNLKLSVEELIGEKELEGSRLKQLLDALRLGKSPREIATLVGKITGKRIKIPREYEKRSGVAYEEEKDSFAYRFRHNILPVIRTAVLAAGIFALLIFLGYRYLFRPLYALTLYNRGYEQLQEKEYPVAGAHFDQATRVWPMKKQFYRYGSAYRDQGEWARAGAMYERLLRRYPLDKQGSLDYADMLFRDLADYRKAVSVLDTFINGKGNFEDPDALLLLADINLEWGKDDPERLEQARLALARLMNTYGAKDEYLFRMLRFFIRTDNAVEVDVLKNRFQADEKLKVDPDAYAELGGYLLDKGDIEEADDILFRAKDVQEDLPEIHYHLSRYFRAIGNFSEELKALNNTLVYIGRLPRLNRERYFIHMDTYRRKGEVHYRYSEYLEAEEAWEKGISAYEDARARGILPVKQEAGMLYADMAQIPYYFGGDLDLALEYIEKAKANDFITTDLKYKTGYIYYRKGEYRQALLNFSSAADGFTTDPNLLFAMANTLYRRENLQAAEGYYRSLISRLEERRASLQNFIPAIDSKHEAVLENLIRTNNNLAVTLYQVYRRTGRSSSYTEALRRLSVANELFENFNRDPDTLERSGLMNLAYLNQRGMVFPDAQYDPQIYPEIPRDMEQLFFSGSE